MLATVVLLILGTRLTNSWLTTAHEVPVVRVMTAGIDTARVSCVIGPALSLESLVATLVDVA